METLNKVCIAKEEKYSENNGAWTIFWLFDGVDITVEGGMYAGLPYDYYRVDATREQKKAASVIYMDNQKEGNNYNKYANGGNGADTFVGCIVSLARSRKAPNKTALKVLEFNDRYYSAHFNNWVSATIDLENEATGEIFNNVSLGCIKEIIKGVKQRPFWFEA